MFRLHPLILCAALTAGCGTRAPSSGNTAPSSQLPPRSSPGVVASVHPRASEAGVDALRRGGNAVDAAVAAALMLGVVDSHNSGIGGGCFVLVRTANGSIITIDGREMAPAAATRDMFVRNGVPQPTLSQTGALAAGVPGSVMAYDAILREAGRLPLAEHLEPAARIADGGFAISEAFSRRLRDNAARLAEFPQTAGVLLDPQGQPWPPGHVLRQPDLAQTYRAIAREGIGWFYGGPFAQAVEAWMSRNGGVLTARDFAGYHIRRRQPLITRYRGYTIVGFPPPSSGGVHVAQVLGILESFNLAAMQRADPVQRQHVMAEAMKLAFADRAFWLGDPDFVRVPRGLTDPQYAKQLSSRIQLDRAIAVPRHGDPPDAATDVFPSMLDKHTTHIAAADAEGNFVAITTTVNTAFGSKVIVPGTGVLLNNQMDDFSLQPGVPNAFGLIGAEANAIAPGKRPLSSMSPTIVLKDGQPVLTLGAAGGPTIISQVVQVIVNHLDLGMPLQEAVAAPRVHHQWRPDAVVVERGMDEGITAGLRRLGHTVVPRQTLGVTQAVARDASGRLTGAADPRAEGTVGMTNDEARMTNQILNDE